jgi:hypothetical protein
MPSRLVTLAIVVGWFLSAGWFVVRDVLPYWRTGHPPPYTIELSDEALRQVVPTRWTFTIDGRKVGVIRTSLHYREADDTFELAAACPEMTLATVGGIEVLARDYDDAIRVTRDGDLRGMRTAVKLALRGLGPDLAARIEMTAEVRDGRLERHGSFEAPGLGKTDLALEPADPPRGGVLNPMHPVPRISGLRPGQEWQQPLTDPRSDILRAVVVRALGGQAPILAAPPTTLFARVLPETQELDWNGETHACLVVEYRNEDYTARTWVRQVDGMVLRQAADAHGETLVLQRE